MRIINIPSKPKNNKITICPDCSTTFEYNTVFDVKRSIVQSTPIGKGDIRLVVDNHVNCPNCNRKISVGRHFEYSHNKIWDYIHKYD